MTNRNILNNYKTKVTKYGLQTIVTYHTTNIVVFDTETITLNFGGWDTVTTRRKMNQASSQFNLGYSVYRKKGNTFVSCGRPLEYGGSEVEYTGSPISFSRGLLRMQQAA